ncbi:colipase-like protein 1 [Lemur catta]|uniref:colipase-like protein 1 n=1 Tax=Lemur catta TaxID=9447 RepID=UPI001E26B311|nr:colipase-like protein 1 [Lemur catta]
MYPVPARHRPAGEGAAGGAELGESSEGRGAEGGGGAGGRGVSWQDLREFCVQNKSCKSQCCCREPHGCKFHCAEKGSEGSLCHTQTFVGLYNECPCKLNLTCVFPKNEKSFGIIRKLKKRSQLRKCSSNAFSFLLPLPPTILPTQNYVSLPLVPRASTNSVPSLK